MRKQARFWLGLGLVAALVGAASAQQVGDGATTSLVGTKVSGVVRMDSTGRVISVDELGRINTLDASRDRDYVVRYDNIISDTISIGTADSTQVLLDTHDVSKAYLLINVTGFSGTPPLSVQLAIRVTGHTNSVQDSSTTFNFDFHPVEASSPTDSLAFGGLLLPNSANLSSTECRAIITYDATPSATTKYPRRASIIVPLKDSHGTWFWSEYTGVMVRVLSATANTPRVTVHYRGTAL